MQASSISLLLFLPSELRIARVMADGPKSTSVHSISNRRSCLRKRESQQRPAYLPPIPKENAMYGIWHSDKDCSDYTDYPYPYLNTRQGLWPPKMICRALQVSKRGLLRLGYSVHVSNQCTLSLFLPLDLWRESLLIVMHE